jgi:uncharacterized membrane protein YvlD (DUF360 family)
MMRSKLNDIVPSLLITLFALLVLEVLSSLIPILGIFEYRLPFNILIVLYLSFRLETPFLPVFVLLIQYVHSFFSIEGWAMGTLAGTLVCIFCNYLRELIHLNSVPVTILTTQLFQLIWFGIVSAMIYMKTGGTQYIVIKFSRFLPESILMSLIAPFLFNFLEKVWRSRDDGFLGGSN